MAVVRAGGGLRIVLLGLLAMSAQARAAPPTEAYVRRLEQEALLQAFQANLLGHDSATAVLQAWCDAHGGGGGKIVAERVRSEPAPLPAEGQAALMAVPGQPVAYRHVRLACGPRVLSEADNWYLPDRLTPAMNQALDGSDAPFGLVVRALGFRRRTLSARVLYHPLPEGWERLGGRGAASGADPDAAIPDQLIRNSAVLAAPDGQPFSYVVETYTGAVLRMVLPAASGRR